MEISNELLSKILGYDVVILKDNTSLNPDRNHIVYRRNNERAKVGSVNKDTLGRFAKEWALSKEFIITSNNTSCYINLYLNELEEDVDIVGEVVFYTYAEFIKANSELEAIIKACEWIDNADSN